MDEKRSPEELLAQLCLELMIIGDFPIRRAKVMNVLYRSLREYLKK